MRIERLALLCATFCCLLIAGCGSSGPGRSPETQVSVASQYENKLIRRPGTTPEDEKVYLVQRGKKCWVVNASWLAAHGFKFPDDVHEITAAELDAIPTGEPIQ